MKNLDTAIENLIEAIREDYRDWSARAGHSNNTIEIKTAPGKKYLKIIEGSSCWGFVVLTENDKKFKQGDILKAATWSAPARNQARGNIFEKYSVQWTGPYYLI
jgi:hypothetical protein